MRLANKFISILAAVMALIAAISCQKEEILGKNETREPVIEHRGEYLVVSSAIALPERWPTNFQADSIMINLSTKDKWDVTYSFWMSFKAHEKILEYTLYLPEDNIPQDGEYRVVSIFTPNGKKFYNRMVLNMSNSCMTTATISEYEYTGLRGSGTEDDPYKITSHTSLITFSGHLQKDPESGFGVHFNLESDIDMVNYYEDPGRVMDQGWCGIGGAFRGVFNGNGYTISNLEHSDSSTDNTGLFKELGEGAEIYNLILNRVNITAAGNNVGALAGCTSGSVKADNVKVIGNINASGNNVGGLIGLVQANIELVNCTAESGTISGSGSSYGGLVGYANSNTIIKNGRNAAMNIHTTGEQAGGLVGYAKITNMDGCESTGTVYATKKAGGISGEMGESDLNDIYVRANSIVAEEFCGGIAGYISNISTIDSCTVFHSSSENYKEAVIGNSSTNNVGGLVGYSQLFLKITNTTTCTPVSGNENAGGFVGCAMNAVEINNSMNSSKSQIKGNKNTGGFIGNSSALVTITGSQQLCNVTGTGESTGGIVGSATLNSNVKLSDIQVNCNITGGGKYTGGIAGNVTSLSITGCEFGSGVTINGPYDTGGIAGRMENSTLTDSTFNGDFIIIINNNEQVSQSSVSVGGIAGSAWNCKFEGITVHCSVYGNQYVGGITGYDDYSTYENCIFNGKEVKGVGSSEFVGGIVGWVQNAGVLKSLKNKGKIIGANRTGGIAGGLKHCGISDSTNEGQVEGGQDTGGIVGYMIHDNDGGEIKVSNCINKGYVTAGKRCLGGICGYIETSKSNSAYINFQLCFNDVNGEVIGTGSGSGDRDGMGGIIGEGKYSFTAVNCGNRGKVEGSTGFNHIGGIAGYLGRNSHGYDNYLKIDECYNTGTVSVTGNSNAVFVGGIVGHLEDAATSTREVIITDCFNRGTVTARSSGQDNAGGIAGKVSFYITMKRCYSSGKVYSDSYGTKLSNGICGTHENGEVLYGKMENLYVEKDTGNDWRNGTFFNNADKGNTGTYSGFNFSGGTWAISDSINDGYPYLPRTPME